MEPNDLPDDAFLVPSARAIPIHTRGAWLDALPVVLALDEAALATYQRPAVGFASTLGRQEQLTQTYRAILRRWATEGIARGYIVLHGVVDALTDEQVDGLVEAIASEDPFQLVADSKRDTVAVFEAAFLSAFPDGFPHPMDDGADLTPEQRHALAATAFLLPHRRLLPVQDELHWRRARGRIFQVRGITARQRAELVARWERIGREAGWLQGEAPAADDPAVEFERMRAVLTDARELPPGFRLLTVADLEEAADRMYAKRAPELQHLDRKAFFAYQYALTLHEQEPELFPRPVIPAAGEGDDDIEARRAAVVDAMSACVKAGDVAGAKALVHELIDALCVDAPLEELTDWVGDDLEVLQDDNGQPLRLKVLLTRANVRNGNRRIYPLEVLQDMVARGQSKLRTMRVTMEQEHPRIRRDASGRVVGFATNPERDAAVIDALYMVGERVYIDVTLLDTPYGRAIAADIRAGRKPRVSLRSLGRLREAVVSGVKTAIATFIDWHGGDWVDNPALVEAGPEAILTDAQVYEALLDSAKEDQDMNKIQELEAQLTALKDSKDADQAEIARLTQALADAKLEAAQQALADAQQKLAAKTQEVEEAKKASGATVAATDAQIGEAKAQIGELTKTVTSLAESVKGLVDDKAALAKQAEAAKTQEAVKAFVDSLAGREDLKRFNDAQRKVIADRVARATTTEQADQLLADAIQDMDGVVAAIGASAMGFNGNHTNGNAAGSTTTKLKVTDNPKPWKAVTDSMRQAYDDHARLSNMQVTDPSIVAANRPFCDRLLEEMAEAGGQAVIDSAELILDCVNGTKSLNDSIQEVVDATGVSNLWNQPVIAMAMMEQQFQQCEALQFVQAFGPATFTNGEGNVGSVLRVPVEQVDLPAGYDAPYYDASMLAAERGAIPHVVVKTRWLSFFAQWRRMGFSLTAEAIAAMRNGPLAYDAWARHTYALAGVRARTLDNALYEEMLLTSDEYNAVAVVNEAVAAPEWTYVGGGYAGGYGANVCGVAQLLCGGVSTAPNRYVQIVGERISTDLKASGELDTTVTANAFSIATLGGVTQVRGYLGKDGQITDIPGNGTATYAIDRLNGKVLFKVQGTSGAALGTRPTVSYTYATNFDIFNLSNPVLQAGETIQDHYAKLLIQLDVTAAGMGSAPRFIPPDLAIMSFNIAALVQNASTWQNWKSAPGNMLATPKVTSNSKFAEKAGVEMAKINAPWSAGDSRILLQRHGSTKMGTEIPFRMVGPVQRMDTGTGYPMPEQAAFAEDKTVIATPQNKDQSGVVRNPVSRTIRLI